MKKFVILFGLFLCTIGLAQISSVRTFVEDIIYFNGTGAVNVQSGSTAQRPATPANGMLRYNSDDSQFEGYAGGAWGPIAGSGGGTDLPVFAKGSLLTSDGTFNGELDVGTNGQVLVANSAAADGSGLEWQTLAASFTTVTKNSTGNLATSGEEHVLADSSGGSITLTLPAASGNSGLMYKITKSTAGNTVTIDGNASETIGGELTVVMASKDDSIIITTDGSNWYYLSDEVRYHAVYTTDAGQTIPNATLTTIVYEDLVEDTHSGMNTGTGVYTIPIDGVYHMYCDAMYSALNVASGVQVIGVIELNGATKIAEQVSEFTATDAVAHTIMARSTRSFSQGDTVECSTEQTTAGGEALNTSSHRNVFSITRIK